MSAILNPLPMTVGDPQREGDGPWYVCLFTHQSNRYAGRIIGDSPADAEQKARAVVDAVNIHASGDADTTRINKLDALLKEDPFHLNIKWDNYQDSGIYIKDGMGNVVAHAEIQSGDDEPDDPKGATLRAALDKLKLPTT